MSRANKLLVGVVIGALILGIAGFLLAPHLLGLAGVSVVAGQYAFPAGVFSWSIPGASGVTAAVFGQLQAGITALAGLIGGLAGGLIGMSGSKKGTNSTLQQYTSLSSIAPITNEKATGYAPSLDIDEQNTRKSFVKDYEQEKLANSQTPPSQWLH